MLFPSGGAAPPPKNPRVLLRPSKLAVSQKHHVISKGGLCRSLGLQMRRGCAPPNPPPFKGNPCLPLFIVLDHFATSMIFHQVSAFTIIFRSFSIIFHHIMDHHLPSSVSYFHDCSPYSSVFTSCHKFSASHHFPILLILYMVLNHIHRVSSYSSTFIFCIISTFSIIFGSFMRSIIS